MNDFPEFSLVVPCYNEEDALPHFFAAAIPALEEMTGGSWRIVCVDDGSRDRTFELILQKHLLDLRVTGVRLSRNFGHQPALAAGLAYINSIGNFCGYLGPIVVGYTKDATGSFEAGIYVLAASSLVSPLTALGCALWMKAPRPRTAPLMVG